MRGLNVAFTVSVTRSLTWSSFLPDCVSLSLTLDLPRRGNVRDLRATVTRLAGVLCPAAAGLTPVAVNDPLPATSARTRLRVMPFASIVAMSSLRTPLTPRLRSLRRVDFIAFSEVAEEEASTEPEPVAAWAVTGTTSSDAASRAVSVYLICGFVCLWSGTAISRHERRPLG